MKQLSLLCLRTDDTTPFNAANRSGSTEGMFAVKRENDENPHRFMVQCGEELVSSTAPLTAVWLQASCFITP